MMIMISAIIVAALIGADQITKWIAVERLKPIGMTQAIEGLLNFTFVENRGAAFGIFSGKRWIFILLTTFVCIAIVVAFVKMPKNKEYNWIRVSFVLIFAGAVGNLIDRVMNGFVVDFLEFAFVNFPVFNLADIYVVIGTLLLAFLMLFVIKEEKK